jgi:hypothetical protein
MRLCPTPRDLSHVATGRKTFAHYEDYYPHFTDAEDRATLGSDPSAAPAPNGTGGLGKTKAVWFLFY